MGYYKIKLNNTNSNLFDTISESFYDDDDDDSYMNDDTCEDTCENKDDVFADSQDINDELDELLSAQDGTILNPYSTIEDIADILEDHGFLLHPFNLDPTVDEWVLDIELEDISDEERQVYLHLEIMKENEDIYMIRAGIVPI